MRSQGSFKVARVSALYFRNKYFMTVKKLTKIIKTLFACAGLIFATHGTVRADTEPNNTYAEADSIGLDSTISGTIDFASGDINDYYKVYLSGNGNVTVNAYFGDGLSGRVLIYNPSEVFLVSGPVASDSAQVTAGCTGSDYLYVIISRWSGTGDYTFSVSLQSPTVANDQEPNNTIAEIQTTLTENQTTTGQLGHVNNGITDSNDFFEYVNPRNGTVTFSAEGFETLNYQLYLYRPNGTLLGSLAPGTGERELNVSCVAAGTYIGRVSQWSGCGSYSVSFNTSTLTDANDEESNNSISEVQLTLQETETTTGQLGHVSDEGVRDVADYFAYENPRNGTVTFSAEGSGNLSYQLYLYRPNGVLVGSLGPGLGERALVSPCLAAGTYIGRINHWSGCGSYTLSFSTSSLPDANDQEPNNNIPEVQLTLQEEDLFTGQLGHVSDIGVIDGTDYFAYENPRNGSVTFSVEGSENLSYQLYLYRPDGALAGSLGPGTGERSLSVGCLAAGTYIGRINQWSGCGSYNAKFETSSPEYSNDNEPNNSFEDAEITAVTRYNDGQIGHANDTGQIDASDFYAIKITEEPFALSFPFEFKGGLSARLILYNSNGNVLASTGITNSDVPSEFSYTFNNAGVYYLLVSRWSSCGSYRFGTPCESGGDADSDNICDTEDTCQANGGILSVIDGSPNDCIGDEFEGAVIVSADGTYGQRRYGLITWPDQDIVTTNSTGDFDLDGLTPGSYRIAHVGTPSLSTILGITNANQLSGCYDLSNLITVNITNLDPGAISADGPVNICLDSSTPNTVSFTSEGAEGPSFRWALLDQSASTVLTTNTTGIFDFSSFSPGTYRVTRAVYAGINPSTVDPQDLPACIRRSNLISVTVENCTAAASLQSQPNPTAGPSVVSFTTSESTRATLEVYDLSGRMIERIFNQVTNPGQEYMQSFDGSNLPNGIYLYRLTTRREVVIDKFMIAR